MCANAQIATHLRCTPNVHPKIRCAPGKVKTQSLPGLILSKDSVRLSQERQLARVLSQQSFQGLSRDGRVL
jgi:hypothetical protein